MRRFFVGQSLDLGPFLLTGDDVHHIRDVLRLGQGDQISLIDRTGADFIGRIEGYGRGGLELTILERLANRSEPAYQAVLYQGLAKGEKMDTIIQKAVELGVSKIVPVLCSRCVVKLAAGDFVAKVARWQRIAESAAKQSGRGRIPTLMEPLAFAAAVEEASRTTISFMPWEGERQRNVRDFLEAPSTATSASASAPLTIGLLIGPEGGFTADEVDLAVHLGIQTVTLGRRILRTETAGAAVLAMLIYRFNDF